MSCQPFSRFATAAGLAIAIAGCGGGGSTSGGAPPIIKPLPGSTLSGHVAILVPNSTKQSGIRSPKSISPSSNSVSILVGSLAPQIADISATSPLCTAVSGGRTCNVPAVAPPGNDTFTITIFDGANATGNKLAIATFVVKVVTGQNWSASAVVSGVVSSVSVSLANAFLPVGVVGSTTLAVSALDAGGNTIIGPYANTVALAASSGSVTISPASLTQSGPPVSVNYDGSQTQNITITASAGSGISSSATLSPTSNFQWIPSPMVNAFMIVRGPDGAIYFGELGPVVPLGGGFVGPTAPGGIARIDPKTLAITQTATGIDPQGLLFTPDGTLWNANLIDNTIGFHNPFSGPNNTNPIPTPSSEPRSLAFGADGNVWFTELGAGKVGRFAPSAPANITEFSLPTARSHPEPIVSGPDNNLWVGESKASQVAKLSTLGTATEYPMPDATKEIRFMAFSTDGNLYVTENPLFNPPFTPGALVRMTVSGAATQLALPPFSIPEGVTGGTSADMFITDFYWNAVGHVNASGAVTLWPLTAQSQVTSSTLYPQEIVADPIDQTLWYTSASTSTNQTGAVGRLILAQGWTLLPQGAIGLSTSGNLAQQLIGIAETGDSSPFTVTSDTPGVVTVAPLSTSNHNFMLAGVAAGTATVTVTDKNGRSYTIPITVTTGTGTVQSVSRRAQ